MDLPDWSEECLRAGPGVTDRKSNLLWPEQWLQGQARCLLRDGVGGQEARAAGQLGAFGSGSRSAQLVSMFSSD